MVEPSQFCFLFLFAKNLKEKAVFPTAAPAAAHSEARLDPVHAHSHPLCICDLIKRKKLVLDTDLLYFSWVRVFAVLLNYMSRVKPSFHKVGSETRGNGVPGLKDGFEGRLFWAFQASWTPSCRL